MELLAATPFKHDVELEGVGTLAEVTHLPPTLSALYYFPTGESAANPYLGLGLNYTVFFSEDFKSDFNEAGFENLSLDSSLGLAVQAGLDYELNDNWLLNGSIRYIDIEKTAEFDVGNVSGFADVSIDPWVYTLSVGYTF